MTKGYGKDNQRQRSSAKRKGPPVRRRAKPGFYLFGRTRLGDSAVRRSSDSFMGAKILPNRY